MPVSEVYQFYRKMEDENIILSFKGTFTGDLLTSILHIIEARMDTLEIDLRKKKRVFNVLVECFQNLYHHIETFNHSEESIKEQNSALIIVKYKDGTFTVTTGNFIAKERIQELEEKLALVNDLDQNDLRNLYRVKLKDDERTEKGTAGLGLIDIARKSNNRLVYEIINVTDSIGFFCLNVKID